MNEIHNVDCLVYMAGIHDKSIDLIPVDPPYALGSEVIIREDGKPDYKKAVDFMDKWDQPDGAFWEQWFREAFRVLKYGGRVIMFGMDRQLMLNKYYACLTGFVEQQSLYWYYISNFPKASDLSKQIDRIGGESLKWFIDYVIDYSEKKGVSKKELTALFPSKNGKMTGWLFNKASGRQSLTIEQYNKIRDFLSLPFDTIEDAEREIIGKKTAGMGSGKTFGMLQDGNNYFAEKELNITAPSTDLAKKYDGLKYSVAPLKQTCETVMVFQKPYKTGSCLHDTLAFEAGDKECLCGALDIDGGRVPTGETLVHGGNLKKLEGDERENKELGMLADGTENTFIQSPLGRYPSQTFVDIDAARRLDEQSGIKTSGAMDCITKGHDPETFNTYGKQYQRHVHTEASSGGCSKILHKCDYEDIDYDLFIYCPKVSREERNAGCEKFDEKVKSEDYRRPTGNAMVDGLHGCGNKSKNPHPTLKPISLLTKILQLFKTPNDQVIYDAFCGSGSMVIAADKLGYKWTASEISPEYCEIARARVEYWRNERKRENIQMKLEF